MRKFLLIAAMAASIGGFGVATNPALASISSNIVASVEKPQTTNDGSFQLARRHKGGGGFNRRGTGYYGHRSNSNRYNGAYFYGGDHRRHGYARCRSMQYNGYPIVGCFSPRR